jgi:transposase
MILLPRSVKIFVATAPANLHRSFEGLSNEVRSVLAADPLSGHVFIFLNRRRNQVKMLLWTRGGFLIVHNQQSSHYTSFRSDLRTLVLAR